MRRTLRVRVLAAAAMLAFLNLVWMIYVAAHYALTGTWDLESGGPAGLWVAAPAGLLLVVLAIGYGLRRSIIRPLESLGRAARQVADGDWDIELPSSGIAEIAQVRSGFEVMIGSLRRSFAEQAEWEEERRFWIGAMAHDLRTPLFAMKGYLDGLEQGIASTPEQMKRYVAVCKEKANDLDRLVSDLFAFAKTEYLEQSHYNDTVDFRAVLSKSADGMRPLAEAKGVSIRTEPAGSPLLIKGDAHLLERAVNNLLDNAVRHTPANGSVYVRCREENGSALLSVRDTGTGFAPSELPRIFDPLYRGEASRNRTTGGAGLGLTIARRIFKAHGGDLSAANAPEGGAELTGRIPVNSDRQAPASRESALGAD
ncbi:sensor histidine kinase [Cohnella zeiphila]|uniref:histidine kinase n=1 Tax=Cohnella zeiphila TaxID=2761120 RepID=A0A7X0SR22_9BACL|nr:HAMP domain-containing sensor histidine kinase [Cohnella zeiphila]MBB6734562.1 HAMP domain-containing histidine kinase [Cohnella zeiphila]